MWTCPMKLLVFCQLLEATKNYGEWMLFPLLNLDLKILVLSSLSELEYSFLKMSAHKIGVLSLKSEVDPILC